MSPEKALVSLGLITILRVQASWRGERGAATPECPSGSLAAFCRLQVTAVASLREDSLSPGELVVALHSLECQSQLRVRPSYLLPRWKARLTAQALPPPQGDQGLHRRWMPLHFAQRFFIVILVSELPEALPTQQWLWK